VPALTSNAILSLGFSSLYCHTDCRSMAAEYPPLLFFPEHGTITQVLSCTLHMLNTVTCIATEVLIGLGEPVLHREARDILYSRSVGSRFNCACQACRCACKKGENKRVRVVLKKNREGTGTFRNLCLCAYACMHVRACVCLRTSISLHDELHAGWEGNVYEKKF